MDEEAALAWQDVFDEIAAGREQSLRCPFCAQGAILVDRDAERVRLECRACRRFVEGRLASSP